MTLKKSLLSSNITLKHRRNIRDTSTLFEKYLDVWENIICGRCSSINWNAKPTGHHKACFVTPRGVKAWTAFNTSSDDESPWQPFHSIVKVSVLIVSSRLIACHLWRSPEQTHSVAGILDFFPYWKYSMNFTLHFTFVWGTNSLW